MREKIIGTMICGGFLCFLGFPSFSVAADPQFCDSRLLSERNISDGSRYSLRGNGSYCEGVVVAKQSASLKLVGVHIGEPSSQANAIISIAKPTDKEFEQSALRLMGLDISRQYNYRLDGMLSSTGLQVDGRVVISALKIPLSDLAFLAWREDGASRKYVPAIFGSGPSERLEAIYVSPIKLRIFRAVVTDKVTGETVQKDVVLDDIEPRSPIRVPIIRTSSSRWIVMRVTARTLSDDMEISGQSISVFSPSQNGIKR